MKADKFTEAVGGIDENIIAQAINTDSAEKLEKLVRAEKMRKVRGCVKIVAAIAAYSVYFGDYDSRSERGRKSSGKRDDIKSDNIRRLL